MKKYIQLMRPWHYIKNFLIFFPLIFSGYFFDLKKLITCIIAFFSFSLITSVVYIINDIKDRDKDMLDDRKKNRPIASKKISVKSATILAIILFILSFILQVTATKSFFHTSAIYLLIYLIINLAYSFGLKNIPLLDVSILVLGFLIRVLYGASLFSIEVSNWLYLTIISLAFYLSLGKRRNEIMKSGSKTREVLKYYNKDFLDKNMYVCFALSIVFYSLWTVDSINVIKTNNKLIFTVPLVILILMKYSMNIEAKSLGDPVEVVLNDKLLLSIILVYGFIVMGIIYLG